MSTYWGRLSGFLIRLLRGLGWFFLIAVVLLSAVVVIVQTRPGMRLLSRLAEKAINSQIDGELRIGSLRGDLRRGLVISDLELRGARGEVLATVGRIRTWHEIESFIPFRLRIHRAEVTRPQVRIAIDKGGNSNWERLMPDKPGREGTEKPAAGPGIVILDEVQVSKLSAALRREGRLEGVIDELDATVRLGRKPGVLPWGRLALKGSWRGLAVSSRAAISPPGKAAGQDAAKGALSGILKQLPPQRREQAQSVALQLAVGASRLDVSGSGIFNADQPTQSRFELALHELSYRAAELAKRIEGMPTQDIEARALLNIVAPVISARAEVHVEKSAKLLVEAGALMADERSVYPLRINPRRLELASDCVLLGMGGRPTLVLKKGDPFPYGAVTLTGCGGTLHYRRDAGSRRTMSLVVSKFEPGRFLTAFAMPTQATKLGTVAARLEFPRGPLVSAASLSAIWDVRDAVAAFRSPGGGITEAKVLLDAQIAGRDLDASLRATIGTETVVGTARLKNLIQPKPGFGWSLAPERAKGTLRLQSRDLKLQTVSALVPGALPVAGPVALDVFASGGLTNAEVDLRVDSAELVLLSNPGAPIRPSDPRFNVAGGLEYGRGEANLKLKLAPRGSDDEASASSALTAEARLSLPLQKLRRRGMQAVLQAPLRWELEGSAFDVSSFFQKPRVEHQESRLTLSLNAKGGGTVSRPDGSVLASIYGVEGKVADAHAKLSNGLVEASLTAVRAPVDPLIALLIGDIRTENAILDAKIDASGSIERLNYEGSARLRADTLRIVEFATAYHALAVDLRADGQRLTLEKLVASSGPGTIQASGMLDLERGKEAEALALSATLKRFEVLSDENMRLEVNGQLSTTANRATSTFGGNLRVDEAKLTLPDITGGKELESLAPLEDVTYAKAETEEDTEGALFEKLHGTVDVVIPGRFWIQTADGTMKVELGADLKFGLEPTDSDFFLTGVVRAKRGSAEFFGRRFVIRQGLAEFHGDAEKPRINAEAVYESSPYNIVVGISGVLPDIKPKLTSDPAGLSEEESIGVLLTGSPDYQSTGTGTSVEGVATGFLVGQLKRRLGPKLPFDTLTAEVATDTGTSATDAESRTQIEIGKYITDRVFIRLGRVFASDEDEPVNRIVLDYRLSSRWSLETTQTDRGRSDLDVLWTNNYE